MFVFWEALIVAFAEDKVCPDNIEKCTCYEPTGYMECNNLDTEWTKKFKPNANYKLDTLVIKKSPKLPLILEHFNKDTSLFAKTVIYTLNASDGDLDTAPGNFNALVKIAQEALEITYNGEKDLNIDAQFLSSKLTSLSLSHVKVNNLDKLKEKEMEVLHNLKLNNITTDGNVKEVIIKLPKLTRIEITNCDELKGSFQFIPGEKCKSNQQIELILQNNKGLTDFDMTKMFDDKNCKYYIDLSGSTLKKSFLTDKKFPINKIINAGQLYIILRDVELDCNRCTYNWYKTMPQYIHSVLCKDINNKPKYLDEFSAETELKPCTAF